jgi:hypothetical protein
MKRRVCAVLVTAALAGCGTGGGGSGGPSGPVSPPVSDSSSPPASDSSSPPASFEFPTLSTVSGDVRVSSAIPAIPLENYEAVSDRVTATADGAGNFTFRVNDPNAGPYTFTVNVPRNSSLTVGDGTTEGALNSLNYSAAGVWGRPNLFGSVGGAAAFGVATGAADLPKTGTATYSGAFIGRVNSDNQNWGVVNASASSLANFGTGVVSFATANSRLNWDTVLPAVPVPELDLAGSMTFQSSGGVRQNSLRGPVSTRGGSNWGMTGEVRGNFFGPASSTSAPPELAGSVAVGRVDGGGEGRSMIGGFVMKR